MMAGMVVIEKNAGSTSGAALRGGDLVSRAASAPARASTRRAARFSSAAARLMTGFMMQRGRRSSAATPAPASATRCTTGRSTSPARSGLGIDASPASGRTPTLEWLERKFRIYGLGARRVPEVRLRQAALELRQPRAVRAEARPVREATDGKSADTAPSRQDESSGTAASSRPRSSTTSTSRPSSAATACAASRCSSRSRTGTS